MATAMASAPARRAGGRPPAAPPPLLSLVDEPARLEDVQGGTCRACSAAYSDEDRNCSNCGAMLRRACASCKRPADDNVRFCTGCGAELPTMASAAPPLAEQDSPAPPLPSGAAAPTELAPSAPLQLGEEWEPDDVAWFAAGVDFALTRMGAPMLEPHERKKIDRRTAAMANKYFRAGGKWKEEIMWVASWATPLAIAAWIKYVVAPDRAHERELEMERARAAPRPSGPVNLEAVQ